MLSQVVQRDRQDQEQLALTAPDTVTLDTTGLDFSQVVEAVVALARERMDQPRKGELRN